MKLTLWAIAVLLVGVVCVSGKPPGSGALLPRAKLAKAPIIEEVLPFLYTAFSNAIVAVMTNWFYPWKYIAAPPGKIGVAQLLAGVAPPPPAPLPQQYYGRKRRSLPPFVPRPRRM